ncbi:Gfo/Idh/MocA family oxidoreductase [Paenarthrobacter sp. PH39-S1]|uniref:Gfo/Idh/MocA family protein n=1 Tax=Paenarthrobacter sp. PH39-S1 TaxID=3046204 RepID=UPI0024BA0A11|nr:Gfo/Idh/MocA family oxidoreductase [Paenarthrobacter sp. PH39-S1]MDJ0354587.1 Gfo/Idh/MocA family oxidoreductase [Paenarthrobacter sp. PH39-S1]
MRIGIIGAGAVASFHAVAAAQIAGMELTAVCDLLPGTASAVADPYGAAVFTNYRALLDSGRVDAVIVNTPHGLHKDMVLAAAEAGVDVLVEKPMATTLADCDEMAAACIAAGVKLVVGQIQHFLPEKIAVERALATGELGAVQMIHDFRSTDYRPGRRSAWFFDSAMSGGGAFINIGGHCLDRSLWFGGAPVASVRATTVNRFGAPVETDGTMELSLTNEVAVSISIVSDMPRNVDELTVVCERGVITADPRRGTYLRRDGETTVLHESGPGDIQAGFTLQLQDFAKGVAGGTSAVSLAHARHIVEVVLAAYESAADGGAVALAGWPAIMPAGASALTD